MSLTILNTDELAELEHRVDNRIGLGALMDRAGEAAAELILERFRTEEELPKVTILVGPGNNGGDGLRAACHLLDAGVDVMVVLPGGKRPRTELARAALEAYLEKGGETAEDPYMTRKADCVVDAMFGMGLDKPLSGDYLDALLWFNEREALKIALDIPSGLNAATGNYVGSFGIRADITIAYLCTKAGLYMNKGADCAGEIVLRELDVSVPLSRLSVVGTDEFAHVRAPRLENSHKGDFGSLGVIAGDTGMIGAALLAARAGSVCGAGRVMLQCLSEKAPAVDLLYPEIMMPAKLDFSKINALVIGCGLGESEKAKEAVSRALDFKGPLIIDADGLNIISKDTKLQDRLLARLDPTVITPHAAEAARLLRRPVEEVTVDRVAACRELAVQTGAIVVLKGAGSVISLRSSHSWINPTGSAALATAGSGDVLAGMIGAFFAQKFDMCEAVLAAVYYHGQAAEGFLAGFTASDIAPNAMAILASDRAEELR